MIPYEYSWSIYMRYAGLRTGTRTCTVVACHRTVVACHRSRTTAEPLQNPQTRPARGHLGGRGDMAANKYSTGRNDVDYLMVRDVSSRNISDRFAPCSGTGLPDIRFTGFTSA